MAKGSKKAKDFLISVKFTSGEISIEGVAQLLDQYLEYRKDDFIKEGFNAARQYDGQHADDLRYSSFEEYKRLMP